MPPDERFPPDRPTGRILDSTGLSGGMSEEASEPGGFPNGGWPGNWSADLRGVPTELPPEGELRRALGVSGDSPVNWAAGRSRWAVPAAAAVAVTVVALFVIGIVLVPSLHGSVAGTVAPGPAAGVSAAQPAGLATASIPVAAVGLATATPVVPAGASASASGYRVYVVGQVRHPGVVALPAGARVEDALNAAGGATGGADLTVINLARKVVDGEQITVPRPGQKVPAQQVDPAAAEASAPGADGGSGAPASAADPVDLNTAGAAQFDTLPGIGPVMAARIVAWRQQNGNFKTVEDLTEVSGIGDATMAKLRPLVRV